MEYGILYYVLFVGGPILWGVIHFRRIKIAKQKRQQEFNEKFRDIIKFMEQPHDPKI